MNFKEYILNEESSVLSYRIGDVLNYVHDLIQDMDNLGNRYLVEACEEIVSAIRKILHSNWTKSELQYLTDLQRVGVGIMISLEDKSQNIKDIVKVANSEIESILNSIKNPINKIS